MHPIIGVYIKKDKRLRNFFTVISSFLVWIVGREQKIMIKGYFP